MGVMLRPDEDRMPSEEELARLAGFLPNADGEESIRDGLIEAGYRGPNAVTTFLGAKILFAAALPLAVFVAAAAFRWPIGNTLIWSIVLAVVGWRRLLSIPKRIRPEPYVAMALAYVLMFIFAFGTIANFGILARERSQMMPYVFVLLSLTAVAARTKDARRETLRAPVSSRPRSSRRTR